MTGAALAVPENVVGNDPIAERLGVDDRWIRKRTGVVERRLAGPDDTVASLAAAAGARTLAAARCDPADVDLLLVATMTPDLITPNVASDVAGMIEGLRGPGAIDVNAACTGWLGSVAMAAGLVETGRADRVLVIASDILSRITNPEDRATSCLFADGAGSVLVGACDGAAGTRIGPVILASDPEGARLIFGTFDEGFLRMKGGLTFGAAVTRMSEATTQAIHAAGMDAAEIDLFVYHQANGRIIGAVGERLDLPPDRVVVTVDHYGNTSAATIPMALAEAAADGRLVEGSKVLLSAFASGFTWAAAVVEWGTGA
jgi:3-oxoacyl-[acyl-carrier-protein] synthase-3